MKRNMRILILGVTVVVMALVLTASLAGATESQSQADPAAAAGVTTLQASPTEQAATGQRWTRAARLAAKPIDVSGVTAEQLAAGLAAMGPAAPSGPAGFVSGGLPQAGADTEAQAAYPAEWAAAEADNAAAQPDSIAPAGTAGIFTAYYTNQYAQMWKVYPYRAVGKLFSNAGTCSASVIGTNTIVTAAHCVYDTASNTWYNNFSFCPAFKNGTCPYGQFAWQQVWIPTNYVNAGSFGAAIRWDVAVIQVGTNSAGKQVQALTGWLGRSWNFDYTQLIFTNGYPAAKQAGKFGYMCVAETFNAGTDIMEMGCNSGPGHSGGPWIKNFVPQVAGATNYVNNVMSYYYTSGSKAGNTMGAARFSSDNIVILCNSAPGC